MEILKYYAPSNQKPEYYDRRSRLSREEYMERLRTSTTLYVGSLPSNLSDAFMRNIFSFAGPVKKIIMGVNRRNFFPCGFCFVEYYNRSDAENAAKYLNNTLIGEKRITIDFDHGYSSGREYGRGKRGGQLEDEKIIESMKPDSNRFDDDFSGSKRKKIN